MSQQSQITIELLRAKAHAYAWQASTTRERSPDEENTHACGFADALEQCASDLTDMADRIAMAGEKS